MHYTILTTLLLTSLTLAHPTTLQPRGVDPSLVPDFGVTAGVDPDGQGSCDGVNGAKIPCDCPPDRNTFISALNGFVDAGNAYGVPVSFPTGDDSVSKKTRLGASIVTLQNFQGPGEGCPVASTTFEQQLQALL